MRDIILKRIAKIKELNRGFEKSYKKWENMEVAGIHISKVDFATVSDEDLVSVFERMIRTSQISTNLDSPPEKRPGYRDGMFSSINVKSIED